MGTFDFRKLTTIVEPDTPLSLDAIDTWAKQDDVKSYQSVWRDANLAFELVDTNDKLQAFLEEYGDVAVLEGDQLRPIIEGSIYQTICNRQGFFRTENVVHRVVGDEVFYIRADKDWSQLSELKPGDPAIPGGGKAQYQNFNQNETLTNAKTQATCQYSQTVSMDVDVGGCTGDRRCYVQAENKILIWTTYFYLEDGTEYYLNNRQPYVSFNITGQKKNLICKWLAYSTQMDYLTNSFTAVAYATLNSEYLEGYLVRTWSVPTTVSFTLPGSSSSGDVWSYGYTFWLGNAMVNEVQYIPVPKLLQFSGKTRAFSDRYATISCN